MTDLHKSRLPGQLSNFRLMALNHLLSNSLVTGFRYKSGQLSSIPLEKGRLERLIARYCCYDRTPDMGPIA
jgi:hypothetical protein